MSDQEPEVERNEDETFELRTYPDRAEVWVLADVTPLWSVEEETKWVLQATFKRIGTG